MPFNAKCLFVVALVANLGCAASNHKTVDKAYATVSPDVSRDTDRARAENGEAIKLIERGDLNKAEEILKQALEADVTFGPAHNNLGKVYYEQGNYYMAAWEFQYAIKLMPYHAEPLNNLGMVLESVGKLDDAVKDYDQALALEPGNPQLVGNNARARIRRGDKDVEVIGLLAQLVMSDTRPDWKEWAREKLVLYRATRAPSTLPSTFP